MGFTYLYSPYPLNADFIRFYPDLSEPEFANGIPDEPEFNIQPTGEPDGSFSFNLRLDWDALIKTNEPLFEENENNGFEVCGYAVNIFENPKGLCRRMTFYGPTDPHLVSVGEPSNFPVIDDNDFARQVEVSTRVGLEPAIYGEPSTPEGAAFNAWIKINNFSLTPEPQGPMVASVVPGKPACFITEPQGIVPTGYHVTEPQWKFLEPSIIQTGLTFGWFPCTGYDFPSEIAADSASYVSTGPLLADQWSCYDCGVCWYPTPPGEIQDLNLDRKMIGDPGYIGGGYQPTERKGFPQPWGRPEPANPDDQKVPQYDEPNQCGPTDPVPHPEPSIPRRGVCRWGNWGPNGAEPDYGYNPPYPDYYTDGFNCRSCNNAMARNGDYGTEPVWHNVLWVDAINPAEKFKFDSARLFAFNFTSEPAGGGTYSGADSCYGRLTDYSCTPGENNSINFFQPQFDSCIQSSAPGQEPNCLDILLDCNEPFGQYHYNLGLGKASPLNIPILNTNIDTGRSDYGNVIVNDWFNNQFMVNYYWIINQVCGSDCTYIPINGEVYFATTDGSNCGGEPDRNSSKFIQELQSQQFKALSNKNYLGIVNQLWKGINIVEEEIPEDVLIVPVFQETATRLAITQSCNSGLYKRAPPPEPPPLPPPPVPGAGGGPGNVFKLEGLCQGKYDYNCNYVRYRPELSMNYQPIAGHPLPYKYIDTMGSSLAKNRQNANLIINASAHRKNTVQFITRNPNCGEYDQCHPPAICPQCTGNRNPNNNPL
jgi:hypothetical protein